MFNGRQMLNEARALMSETETLLRTNMKNLEESINNRLVSMTNLMINIKNIHKQLTDMNLVQVENKYLLKTYNSLSEDPNISLKEYNNNNTESTGTFYCTDIGSSYITVSDGTEYIRPIHQYLIKEGFNKYGNYKRVVKSLTEEEFELMSGNEKIEVQDDTE